MARTGGIEPPPQPASSLLTRRRFHWLRIVSVTQLITLPLCIELCAHIKVRGVWCCAALPPGVYSTTSSDIYRMYLRPDFTGGTSAIVVAARRNQTGHRTSNGAPAAAYKEAGVSSASRRCDLKYVPLALEYLLVTGGMLIAAGDHALIFPARPSGRGDRRDNAAKGGQHDIRIHKQPTFLQN